jgi:hypothetical protein
MEIIKGINGSLLGKYNKKRIIAIGFDSISIT